MIEKNIFIFSGPIHSGKTTKLINWSRERTDVWGILTPIINGKRFFMDAATKEIFPMEATTSESDALTVGKYIFSASAFDRARQILLNASDHKSGWLIIDEVGPLELRGEGFHEVIKKILSTTTSEENYQDTRLQLVLVIRESLLEAVVNFFGIEKYEKFDL